MESKMVCQSSISTEQKSFGLASSDSLSSLRSLVVRFSGKEVLSLKLESSLFSACSQKFFEQRWQESRKRFGYEIIPRSKTLAQTLLKIHAQSQVLEFILVKYLLLYFCTKINILSIFKLMTQKSQFYKLLKILDLSFFLDTK